MITVVVVDTTLSGSTIGGAQTFLSDLAAGLSSRGVRVHLITMGKIQKRVAAALDRSGARIHKNLWTAPFLVEDITPGFARWVNDLNPDAFVVSVSPDIGWTVLPSLRPDIATLAIAHGESATFFRPIMHYARFLTCAIGVSGAICDRIQSECGVPEDRVVWIPYGVYPGACPAGTDRQESRRPIRLVYAGRLTDSQKRASDLVRLAERLRDRRADYHLDIVGDGPLLPEFRRALAHEVTSGRVTLHGWLERSVLHKILDGSDVFLLTSDSEGFPIALVEGMAHGLTPIVTDIPGGNRQLVRSMETGMLVPVGGINEFVRGIQLLDENRPLLRSLRVAAWHAAQPFTMERMIDAYLECLAATKQRARIEPRMPEPAFPLMERCRSRYPLWLRRIKVSVRRIAP